MNVRILGKDEYNLKFVLEDVPLSFANSLRRIILAEVPTLAFDNIVIVENNSALFDEVIAHRMSLIPLVTDPTSFSLPSEHNCPDSENGCPQCLVTFVLDKTAEDTPLWIYSGDLKSSNPKCEVASKKIPLTKLRSYQRISLEGNARMGIGMKHAKWQCVSTVAFQYMPEVNINRNRVTDESKRLVEACPQKIFTWQNGTLGTQNTINCTLCNACVEVDKSGAVSIRGDDHSFLFTLESSGAYAPEKIVDLALGVLLRKLSDLKLQLEQVT